MARRRYSTRTRKFNTCPYTDSQITRVSRAALGLTGPTERVSSDFTGQPSEEGAGEGKGTNCNWPVNLGASTKKYLEALQDACKDVSDFKPLYLVVSSALPSRISAPDSLTIQISLGVDTYKDDPLTDFGVGLEAYKAVGEMIGDLGMPTLFVMEG